MKIIYVSSLMSKKKMNYIINNSMSKPPQSIQRYHRLLCEGLTDNNCEVKTISALPISNSVSKQIFWKSETEIENDVTYQYLPFVNIIIIRQLFLFIFTFLYSIREIIKNNDVVFICDVLNTSISMAALIACKLFGIKSIGIVTDMPSDMRESKKLSIFLNNIFLSLYDSYVFLTEYMNEKINKKNKPYLIIEGICEKTEDIKVVKSDYIMYAGGLYEKYGLKYLIEGFEEAGLQDIKLKIFGTGPLEEEIKQIKNSNIIYGGVVTNDEILTFEKESLLLINPRYSNEEYTKYSFPSKNMEYMSSATPVLTTKLKGIPEEYFHYTYQIEEENKEGIKTKLIEIFNKPKKTLEEFGKEAQSFVLKNKNKDCQAKKLKSFLTTKPEISKDSKLNNIYGFFLLFITIILSRNTLITSDILGFHKSTLFLLIAYIPLIIIYLKEKKYKNHSFILSLLIILMLISIIIKRDFQLYNFTIIIYLLLSYIYVIMYKTKNILKWFTLIISFLSLYSLLATYIIYPCLVKDGNLNNLSNNLLYFKNIEGIPFLNLFLSFPVVLPGYVRNFGIFTEPGFYQYYLILTIIILISTNIFSNKLRVFLSIIAIITMISTFSAAGYICMIVFLLPVLIYKMIIMSKLPLKNKKKLLLIILLSLLATFLIIYLLNDDDNVISQMLNMIINKLTSKNASSTTRLYSLKYTFQKMLEHPVFGNNFSAIVDSNVVITNTNISYTAIYGLISGILLVIMQYRLSSKISNTPIIVTMIFITLLLSANNHLFIGIHSFWLMLLMGLKEEEYESSLDCK